MKAFQFTPSAINSRKYRWIPSFIFLGFIQIQLISELSFDAAHEKFILRESWPFVDVSVQFSELVPSSSTM